MDYFNCSRFCHFIVGKFIVTPYTIKGESMDPTLKDGERVAVNIIGYKQVVWKGNVVVFHANKNDDYVKRVIGVPGDKVEYKMIHYMSMAKTR